MSIRAIAIPAMTAALMLAGGCSPSSGESPPAADRGGRSADAGAVAAPPPALAQPQEADAAAPLPVRVKDLPPDKALASSEGEAPPQSKEPEETDGAAYNAKASHAYHPLDLPPSSGAAQVTPFPDEVTNFMVERDSCDHFRGEEPYDEDRRAYLAENIAELCTGTDARLATLRLRYAGNPSVTAALSGYEDRIESGPLNSKYPGK